MSAKEGSAITFLKKLTPYWNRRVCNASLQSTSGTFGDDNVELFLYVRPRR